MRNYKAKMQKYRLPPERYRQLRDFCLCAGREEHIYIEMALAETCSDNLSKWLYRHVASTDYGWLQMEADSLPCSRDTFRIYRAKFYWTLDRLTKRGDFF